MVSALTSTGVDVLDLGIVPTPLTYFAAHTAGVDGICMITGSHNPPEYNGLKVGLGLGDLPRRGDPGAPPARRVRRVRERERAA